jgi:hypothetical protein
MSYGIIFRLLELIICNWFDFGEQAIIRRIKPLMSSSDLWPCFPASRVNTLLFNSFPEKLSNSFVPVPRSELLSIYFADSCILPPSKQQEDLPSSLCSTDLHPPLIPSLSFVLPKQTSNLNSASYQPTIFPLPDQLAATWYLSEFFHRSAANKQ